MAVAAALTAALLPQLPAMADEASPAETTADSVLYSAAFDNEPCVGEDVVRTSQGSNVKVNECFPAYEVGVTGALPHNHTGVRGNSDDKTSKWILPGDGTSYPYRNDGAGTSNTYQLVSNVFGKADKALKMTPANESSTVGYYIPAESGGINDTEGAWFGNGGSPYRGALANATADLEDGQQLKISFDIARSEIQGKKVVLRLRTAVPDDSTKYKDTEMKNSLGGSEAMSFNNDGTITFMGLNTGTRYEAGKWYSVEMIFTKGSKSVSLYINGEAVAPNGYFTLDTTAALQENFTQLFRASIVQDSGQTSDMYLDNFEITAMAKGTAINTMDNNVETFDMFKDYSSALSRYKYMDFLNMNNGDGYSAKRVSGMFGKAADDVSMKLAIEPLGTNQNTVPQIKMYQYEYIKNWQYGDKIRMGIRFAYDSDLFYNTMVLHLRDVNAAGNSTLMDFMKVMDGKLNFMGTDYKMNWTPNNWYNLEWVIEPGNGVDVKNKITAYVDGTEIASNEFDADKTKANSAMAGIFEGRITLDNALNGWNNQADQVDSGKRAGFNLYLDDYTVCRTANNSVTPVTVTADGITTGYKSTLFIKNNETIGQLKSKVNVSGGTAEYVAANGTALADDASAAGGYLKITASSGTVYYYSIVNNIMWHEEDFESYDVIENTKYKGTVLDIKVNNSSSSGKKKLAGKSGQAYGFDYNAEDGAAGDASGIDFNRKTSIPVEDTTVVEFSMYANENVEKGLMAGGGAQYYYEYTNDNGETVSATDGIRNLITMERGYIYSGESITGNEICKAENGRWYKIALVMNPSNYTMDIYVNGELKKANETLDKIDYVVDENQKLQPVDRTMEKTGGKKPVLTGILRFKAGGVLRATEGANSGTYAYDDVKIYAGSYNSAADTADITVKEYPTANGIIKIDSNEDCEKSTFMSNIVLNPGVRSAELYDDDTLSGSQEIDSNGVYDGNILAVETESGTMHYYLLKDIAEETSAELKLYYNDTEIQQGTAGFEKGTYTMKAVINKNDETAEDYLAVLALKKGGRLIGVKFVPQTVTAEGETTIPVEMNVEDTDGITFEAYLWDSTGGMNVKADSVSW